MVKKTRRMSKASQVAFAKSWVDREGIESQLVDVEALIDGSLSYEENIKLLKKHLKKGGRSQKKATRTMSASECDVSIGNYSAGMDGRETRRACECGDPDACDDLSKKKPKPKPKPKAKPKKSKKEVSKVVKKKRSAQTTVKGKRVPQKKKKAKTCKVVRVAGHTRKCPTKKRR